MSSQSEVFRRVVDGMDLGIVLTDADQKIAYANSYAFRLFGTELLGQTADSVRPLISSAAGRLDEVLRGEVLVLNEPQNRQTRCYLNIAPLSRDEGEPGLVWTFFELTEEIANTQAFIDFSTELTMANRELRRKNAEILVLSRTDWLTGLANRRTILEVLEKAIEFGSSRGQSVAVALVAIDGFKDLNVRLGRLAGDEVLRKVAAITAQTLGSDGTLGRYSSKELLMVLPGTEPDQARALAEEVRKAVQKGTAQGKPVTVTIAVVNRTDDLDKVLQAVETLVGVPTKGNKVVTG